MKLMPETVKDQREGEVLKTIGKRIQDFEKSWHNKVSEAEYIGKVDNAETELISYERILKEDQRNDAEAEVENGAFNLA